MILIGKDIDLRTTTDSVAKADILNSISNYGWFGAILIIIAIIINVVYALSAILPLIIFIKMMCCNPQE